MQNNWVYSLRCLIGWGWKCYWFAQWSRKQDNQIDQRCCNLRISATRYTGKLPSRNSSSTIFIKCTIKRPKLMTVLLIDVVTVGAASGRNAAEAKRVYQASSVGGWEEQLARAVGWRIRSKTKSGKTYFNTDDTGISAIAKSLAHHWEFVSNSRSFRPVELSWHSMWTFREQVLLAQMASVKLHNGARSLLLLQSVMSRTGTNAR